MNRNQFQERRKLKPRSWFIEHLKQLTLPVDGVRIATFQVNGQECHHEIPEPLWQHCLRDSERMDELRRAVKKQIIREDKQS